MLVLIVNLNLEYSDIGHLEMPVWIYLITLIEVETSTHCRWHHSLARILSSIICFLTVDGM